MSKKDEIVIDYQICPLCAGRQLIAVGNKNKTCPQCQGEGQLEIGEKRMHLYPAKAIRRN